MRVALISDIHGNLVALEAVLAELALDRPDSILCLGDVAATGPQPHETIERLRALDCPMVMGNADAELLRPLLRQVPEKEMSDWQRIREIDHWCATRLSAADLDYLRGFLPVLEIPLEDGHELLCFHGSPRSFDDVIEATTPDKELECLLSGYEANVMAGGRTHIQLLRRYGETTVLNPGSVGLNPEGAEYALVSSEGGGLRIEFRRLQLSGEEMKRSASESGMPHAEWWASFWR